MSHAYACADMLIVLTMLLLLQLVQKPHDVLQLADDKLSTMMYLMSSTVSMVLKSSLDALMFFCDMFSVVPLISEWQIITHNREALVTNDLLKSNQQCTNFDYFVRK